MNLNPHTVIWVAVSAVAALVVIGLIATAVRRSQSDRLQEHFGKEYERTVEHAGNRKAAERELVQRAEEVKSFDIRALTAADRNRFTSEWRAIEARFVDRPTTAVVEADELIADVLRTRGYPVADFEEHAAHLSVKHPRVVEHYRAGHAALESSKSTEELRQAMLHYRTLFEELVGRGGDDVAQEITAQREMVEPSPRERLASRLAEEEAARR